MKKILLLSEGEKISGPTTWKTGLISSVNRTSTVIREFDVTRKNAISYISLINSFDIIHAYHVSGATIIFLIITKLFRKKIVFTLHGNFYMEKKSKKGLKKILWVPFHLICLTLADIITVPSRYLYNEISKKNARLMSKAMVIFNGIRVKTTNRSKQTSSPKMNLLLLSITNFNIYKKAAGIVPLVNAIKKISTEIKGITLDIVGGGKYLTIFKNKYQDNVVRFVGYSNRPQSYIKKADIFVHATFLDNLPYTILEAMMYHKPVISVRVGGIPEILPANALTNPTSEDLYIKIKEVITSPSLQKKMVDTNKKLLSKFHWQTIVKQFIGIYENN